MKTFYSVTNKIIVTAIVILTLTACAQFTEPYQAWKVREAKRLNIARIAPEKAAEIGSPIAPLSISGNKNYLDGVKIHMYWQNLSDKTIKYLIFTVEARNAVGDLVLDDIHHKASFTTKLIGPHSPGKQGFNCGPIFYSDTASSIKLLSVSAIFMDGTKTKTFDLSQWDFLTGKISG